METGLKEKVVLITGAARGIGFATAKKFAAEQSIVVIVDINEEEAKEAASTLEKDYGIKSCGYGIDLSKKENIDTLFEKIANEHGRLDVLINNAGVQIRNDAIEFQENDWDKLMDINLKAVFFCSQCAAKIMKENGGGAIVNLASGSAKRTTPGRAPYVISKAGVISLTEVISCEWAKYGIRMNAVAPGWIMTQMVKDGMKMGIVSEAQLMAAIPFKRLADVSEIADAILYLASDNASYITGQTMYVDGGQTALGLPDML